MATGIRVTDAMKENAVFAVQSGEEIEAVAKRYKVKPLTIRKWHLNSHDKKKFGKVLIKSARQVPNKTTLDAIVYLEQGLDILTRMLKSGNIKRLDPAHCCIGLALDSLTGNGFNKE